MIVITAPTGQIGSRVLERLLAAGEPVRVVARDPSRLPDHAREAAEVVTGSHADRAVVEQALDGADAVFWLPQPDLSAPSVEELYTVFTRPAADAFAAAGVSRVVGVSALGRGTDQAGRAGMVTAALAMDDQIAASGVAYRALVNPSFMDNLLRQVGPIREQGAFFGPLDPGRPAPTCATRDIADAAVDLLTDDAWTGFEEHPVLGPEDLSQDDLAAIAADVLGREVRYRPIPWDAFRAQFADRGMPELLVDAMVDMYAAKEAGLDLGVARTDKTASPTTFRQWCEETLKPAVEAADG